MKLFVLFARQVVVPDNHGNLVHLGQEVRVVLAGNVARLLINRILLERRQMVPEKDDDRRLLQPAVMNDQLLKHPICAFHPLRVRLR